VLLGEIIHGKDLSNSNASGKYDLLLLLQWLHSAMQLFTYLMDFSQSWQVWNQQYI